VIIGPVFWKFIGWFPILPLCGSNYRGTSTIWAKGRQPQRSDMSGYICRYIVHFCAKFKLYVLL